MSTNKTTNYNLHSWAPDDDFSRQEMNENFAALDAGLGGRYRTVVGTYTGNGAASRTIDLGAPIAAVLVECTSGQRGANSDYMVFGGLAAPGFPLVRGALTVQGSSFTVAYQWSSSPIAYNVINENNKTFVYVAWIEQP